VSKGQLVTVKLYGGKTATRRIVAVKRDVVVICTEEEYRDAELQGREPSGLGFPYEDIILPSEPLKKEAGSERPVRSSSRAGD
jgi:hypothetical protein